MIYFVSDIHLGGGSHEEARRTEQGFCRWLDTISKDASEIYLLGDIFDFWFEYQRVAPKGFTRTLGRLAELSDRGVKVVFLTGNHDMWTYDYLTRECGIKVHNNPQVVELQGELIHLAHGDNLNIKGDPILRAINTIFRSRTARWLFSWLVHPDLALKFGHWWSGKSRKAHGGEPITTDRLDYLAEYARKHHSDNVAVHRYIFGHMHLPHRLIDKNIDIIFLSDWSRKKATYATLDEFNNLDLKTFDIDETISGTS